MDAASPVRSVFPIIATSDLPRSLAFWRDVMGGSVSFRFPPDGDPAYVGVDLGSSHVGIGADDAAGAGGGGRISLWCYVDDCDAVVDAVRAAGLRVLEEPTDRPWGERVATVEDPDGNRVHVGTEGA